LVVTYSDVSTRKLRDISKDPLPLSLVSRGNAKSIFSGYSRLPKTKGTLYCPALGGRTGGAGFGGSGFGGSGTGGAGTGGAGGVIGGKIQSFQKKGQIVFQGCLLRCCLIIAQAGFSTQTNVCGQFEIIADMC
jgi:hypothetical protein